MPCANTQMIADRVEEITVIETNTTDQRNFRSSETPDASTNRSILSASSVIGRAEVRQESGQGDHSIRSSISSTSLTQKGYDGYTLIVAEEIVEFCCVRTAFASVPDEALPQAPQSTTRPGSRFSIRSRTA